MPWLRMFRICFVHALHVNYNTHSVYHDSFGSRVVFHGLQGSYFRFPLLPVLSPKVLRAQQA